MEDQWNRSDCFYIVRHVIALFAVATGDGTHQFDDLMRELQDLEKEHPEYQDDNSPTMRVGSDLNKNFTQVAHKYPMLSLGNVLKIKGLQRYISIIFVIIRKISTVV